MIHTFLSCVCVSGVRRQRWPLCCVSSFLLLPVSPLSWGAASSPSSLLPAPVLLLLQPPLGVFVFSSFPLLLFKTTVFTTAVMCLLCLCVSLLWKLCDVCFYFSGTMFSRSVTWSLMGRTWCTLAVRRYRKYMSSSLKSFSVWFCLWFGSFDWFVFQDVYPKGVIPLAAIQMARPAKDNKFEIVTSHRIFVFRTDNEGKKHTHTVFIMTKYL